MSTPKLKTYPASLMARPFTPWLQSCAGVLAINWLAQGWRGMDPGERRFRALLQLTATALITALLSSWLPLWTAAAIALPAAHTANFLLNGQFWLCLRYCPNYRNSQTRLNSYLHTLAETVRRYPFAAHAVIIGSAARGQIRHARSDIDLRLIAKPGLISWLQQNLALLSLRAHAFIHRMPLDLYGYDSTAALNRFDPAEPIWVLKQSGPDLDPHLHNREVFR